MNKNEIIMPSGVRYMSQADKLLFNHLPRQGKYILDKTLTGCGGTELFISSGLPLVLVSPRTGVLISKHDQHPECHLLRDEKTKIEDLKKNLKAYLAKSMVWIYGQHLNPVVLTTIDSAKYVIEELNYQGITDKFIFLVDEFQCLIGDAAFKGKTDLEFIKLLDSNTKNICYMSATPIPDTYLDALPEFQNIPYYKLRWDQSVIVEHTVKEIQIQPGETVASIFSNIIKNYRRDGYFAKKIINGQEYRSSEVVVFVNAVETIQKIIKDNNLAPDETTILISESNKAVRKLENMGFKIGAMTPDKVNPINKTFTFCSKAAFEGRDFYSTNAFTYIFLDGKKEWQTHDISIEIPQMLGRQRLDINPFKYNATIYYRTKPTVESESEFFSKLNDKMDDTTTMLEMYNNGTPPQKKALAKIVAGKDPNNPYSANYLDVIHDAKEYKLEINYLVIAAEHNLWANQVYFYNNPLNLTTAIQTQMAIIGQKPQELRDFETDYNKIAVMDQLRYYATFRATHPEFTEALYQNPFIDFDYHKAFDMYGVNGLFQLNYDIDQVKQYAMIQDIVSRCERAFVKDRPYRADDVKKILQQIYDNVGYNRTATATQLEDYLQVRTSNSRMTDGSRQKVFIVV